MSRRRAAATGTGDLFAIPRPAAPIEGSMDYRPIVTREVREMLAEASAAGMDRWDIALRASKLAGRDVSKMMLDGYTADSREEFNVPLWLAPVLETACDSTRLSGWLAGVRGGRLLIGEDVLDAEVGRAERAAAVANDRLRALREMRRRVR